MTRRRLCLVGIVIMMTYRDWGERQDWGLAQVMCSHGSVLVPNAIVVL